MTREPHFVRFAQALALVTGLAGCSATTTGTGDAGGTGGDAASGDDAAMVADAGGGGDDAGGLGDDAGAADDADVADAGGFDCTTCDCGFTGLDAGLPVCPVEAQVVCGCVAIGPLAPPDLMV